MGRELLRARIFRMNADFLFGMALYLRYTCFFRKVIVARRDRWPQPPKKTVLEQDNI